MSEDFESVLKELEEVPEELKYTEPLNNKTHIKTHAPVNGYQLFTTDHKGEYYLCSLQNIKSNPDLFKEGELKIPITFKNVKRHCIGMEVRHNSRIKHDILYIKLEAQNSWKENWFSLMTKNLNVVPEVLYKFTINTIETAQKEKQRKLDVKKNQRNLYVDMPDGTCMEFINYHIETSDSTCKNILKYESIILGSK